MKKIKKRMKEEKENRNKENQQIDNTFDNNI